MVLPVVGGILYGTYIVATTVGRVAISVIARYAAKHGIKKAATRFGSKIFKNNRVKSAVSQATKQLKTTVKGTVKGQRGKIISKAKPKVKFKATSKKQIAIQKKIAEKAAKKPIKAKPSKVTTAAKKSPKKPSKVITAAKKPIKIPKKKPSKVTTAAKKSPKKPTKVPKKAPSKKVTPAVTAGGKIPKIPKSKALTITGLRGKKIPSKAITTISKTKKFKPGFWTGTAVGGALSLLPLLKGKFKAPPLKPGIKGKGKPIIPKIKPKPKPKKEGPEGGTRKEYRPSPGFVSVDDAKQSRQFGQTTAKPSATFESRVRALVAQKDRLKNIAAGGGTSLSEYQVRMHKLKLENKKAWKKLFTLGGKLK